MINADKKPTDNGHKQFSQASLELLPLIMNNIPQAVFWKDQNLVYLGCNRAFADDAGFSSPEEVIGKTDFDMPWKDQAELYRADDRHVLDCGEPKLSYEEPQTTPAGSTTWLRTSKIPVQEKGQVVAILGMYEDITAYKKAQETSEIEKQRFHMILETVRVPTIISRLSDGIVLYANQALADISQVHLEKLIGFKTGSFYVNTDDQQKVRDALRGSGHIEDYEVQFKRTDGSTYWALLSSRIIDYEDEKCVLSTYIDITARKQAEADLLLRDRALASSTNAVIIIGLDFKPIYVNEAFLKITGYTHDEAMHLSVPEITANPEGIKRIDVAMETQGFFIGEEFVKRKDGSAFPTNFSTSFITNTEGQPIAIQSNFMDITESKSIEQRLNESEERYRRLSDATVEGIVIHDKGILLDSNETFAKMFGYELSEVIGMTATAFLTPETRDITTQNIRSGYEKPYEVMGLRKDGSTFPVEITGKVIHYEGRSVRVTALRDITERKRAEVELQQEKSISDAIINGLPGVFFLFDSQGKLVRWNNQYEQVLGYTTEETATRNALDPIADEDKERAATAIQQTFVEGQGSVEANFVTKDGRYIPYYFFGQRLQLGDQLYLAGSGIDITERKRAEQGVAESEERFRSFTEATIEGLIFHERGTIIDVNPAAVNMIGSSDARDLIGRNLLEFIAPEFHKLVMEKMQSETVLPYEIQCIHADGTIFPVETSTRAYKLGDREIRASSMRDITARKRAEAQLQQEKSFSDVIINGLPGVFYLFDAQGKMLRWNKQYEQVLGYTAEEIANRTALDPIADEDKERVMTVIQRVFAEGQATVEAEFTTKDGRRIPYYFAGQLLRVGDQVYLAGTGIDITERKRAEQALRENQQLLQLVMDNIPQAVFWKDRNLSYLGVNQSFAEDAGFASPQELVGKNDFDMPWKEQAELYRADDQRVFDLGETKLNYEEPQTSPTGEITWLRTSKIPMRDTNGQIFAVLGMYEDITERKRLEAQVREALERRGLQVQLSTQVSQSIAAAASLGELYERVVAQVKEQFGYYHTQLLRYDAVQEAVVLVTGYGEVGAKMLAARHHLPMGEGLIGTAAATGETVLRPALENDPDWHPNPLLLETKGEIAVPIKLGNTILGVLDVQSSVANALDADDQLLLEGLCGQIAIAIESTRLREDMSERLEEINRLYRSMSHEGWQSYRQSAQVSAGFVYDQAGLRPAEDTGLAEELFANIPLTVPGGEVIGSLAVADDPQRPLSAEDVSFLQQVSEQVALALESARLFEQTQSALATIQENGARLSEALKIAKLGHWEYDLEKDLFTFNDQFYSIFRTTIEEVGSYELSSAQYAQRFVYPEDAPLVGKEIERALADTSRQFTAKVEHRVVFPDGELGYIAVSINLERDENGKITRWSGANQDITERKKAELAIQESQAALEEVMTVAGMANWQLDFETFMFTYNDRLYQMLGTTAAEEGGYEMSAEKYVGTYIHPEDAGLIMGAIQEGLQSPDPENFKGSLEYRMIRKDGQTRYMLTDYRLIVNKEGKAVAGVGSFLDITERKLAELTIAKRAEELKTVATVSTTASSVLDPDQLLQEVVDLTKERFALYHAHIYTYDAAWNTLLLTAGAGEVGRKLVAEEHAIPLTLEQSLVARAARERKPVISNDVRNEPDFLPNPLLPDTCAEMAIAMIVGDKLLGVFDVQSNHATGFSDEDANIYVTLATQVGVALQNARSYAEQAALVTQLRELDRLKSSFLANMSHELRTPLNSILGFADVIIEELDGPLTENMTNDLRLIQKNGQHLLHLINDVLDMAKIEAGRMNLNPEKFTAIEVLDEVTSITSTLASEKNLALFIDPESNRDVKIYADRTRLRQVMINLVNNAIKFTENGKISLKLAALEGAQILFTIKDTGIGIPPDKLEAVFQEFTQVDSSTTRKVGGTGLGLPISRRLVEMHGGRLWAESTGVPGEGSTFFVELPVEARITDIVEK